MALVLPALRLWLLLLNIYGTFKAMKPPPQTQRSARNNAGPSARAMQLRKRELKSCLAVWVVWSIFSTGESLLDNTIGLFTPFYNEFKCLVVLFLLVARAHGAEAIFLHFIHPLLRPYVPAIDDILANLHSMLDLLLLLLFLPFEYISHWWHRWSWGKSAGGDEDGPPSDHEVGSGGEALPEGRRVLRPRAVPQQARMREADRQARVVFQDIDDAQDRVRARALNQPVAPAARNVGRNQPNRGDIDADLDLPVGLRTRKRVLEYPPADRHTRGPGSSTTGVHHVYKTAMENLPPAPSLQPFPVLPTAPITQPVTLPRNPLPVPPQPSTRPSSHEVWHPPHSAFEHDRPISPADTPRRTPSPLYPPLPSAYLFTPRRSEPLPPPPRIITPPHLVMPTPRRVSTGTASSQYASDAFEGTDKLSSRTNRARPSRHARSAEPPSSLEHAKQGHVQEEHFFGQALEPSIQAAETDMDVEIISTRDDSSANEEDIEVEGSERGMSSARRTGGEPSTTRQRLRGQRKMDSEVKKGKRKASTPAEPLRRSTRRKHDEPPGVERDEFGFTIRPGSSTLGSVATASTSASPQTTSSSTAGPSNKKPLARTKPALKPVQGGDETESSDEESGKKRQRLHSDATPEDVPSEDQDELKPMPPPGRGGTRGGRGKRKGSVQRIEGLDARKSKQKGVHTNLATRVPMKRSGFARKDQLHSTDETTNTMGK